MANKNFFRAAKWLLMVGISQLVLYSCVYAQSPAKISDAGILLTDDKGKILYSQNRKKQFIPASTLKILTSLAAMHFLGPDYKYGTEYIFDQDSKNLYLRGKADPLFISEEIEKFSRQIISTTKTKQIRHIILDHTYFSKDIHIPGKGYSSNPYDAPVGALCANFNTVMFKWDGQENKFTSAEPQTPLLPIFLGRIKKTNLKEGRIILSENQSRLYPGYMLQYFLRKNNIKVTGKILEGRLDTEKENKQQFFSSFKITDIVQKLLKYSNNFIANQILLTIGVEEYGEPATLKKGVKALNKFAQRNLGLNGIQIMEGSGLSRSNRISPEQMIKILFEFMPYHALLNKDGKDYYKTGTLSGVRTRAGYIAGSNNRLYPYIIMVNQKNGGYDSIHKKLLLMIEQITKNET